ncbi:flagellar export protein FliJ [Paenibacillus sp. HJGM_3]|uniref:flagellar export protein FliJ n=1 Tax=Paenibacillus sp. HJGM_3 TaxID=3379816 RepID=UPI00385CF4A5
MHFRYPLQKLVDLKSNEKIQAEWGLSEAIGLLHSERNELAALEAHKDEVQHQLGNASANRTTASQLMLLQDYVEYQNKEISRKMKAVVTAERLVEQRQQELSEKMKEEKVWEKAKEKAYAQFISMMQKKEQAELDEIALTRRVQTV